MPYENLFFILKDNLSVNYKKIEVFFSINSLLINHFIKIFLVIELLV